MSWLRSDSEIFVPVGLLRVTDPRSGGARAPLNGARRGLFEARMGSLVADWPSFDRSLG
ncbi:hypothetical protein SBV1_100011 [Verrucomicrobia bacterium]|nr:hypothetical protein SBV1_100011 [Verrucomicrobiota bacterium]